MTITSTDDGEMLVNQEPIGLWYFHMVLDKVLTKKLWEECISAIGGYGAWKHATVFSLEKHRVNHHQFNLAHENLYHYIPMVAAMASANHVHS